MFQRRTQSQPGSRGSSFRGGGLSGGTPRTGERGEQQPGGQRTTSPPPPSYLFQVAYKESHENTHLRLPFGSYQENFSCFLFSNSQHNSIHRRQSGPDRERDHDKQVREGRNPATSTAISPAASHGSATSSLRVRYKHRSNLFRLLQMFLISHRVNRYQEVHTLLRGLPTSL